MTRGSAAIIFSLGTLVWPSLGLAQGAIYKWVDSKGTVHYSNTPTGAARSIDAELPPAASFGTQSDSTLHAAPTPAALPAHGATADAAADAIDVAEIFAPFDQNEEEGAVSAAGMDEDFALGQDGPFGPDNSND